MIAHPAPAVADELVPLPVLAERFSLPYSTLLSWARRGVAGHTLRTWRLGTKRFCRAEWLADFIEKTNRDL